VALVLEDAASHSCRLCLLTTFIDLILEGQAKLKSEKDLEAMRPACQLARKILDLVCDFVRPGVTTLEIDQYAAELIRKFNTKSAFLGYRQGRRVYPCHICISPNEEIVHGLASKRVLEHGDIVSLDVGVVFNGFIGDNARTVPVGGCSIENQKLLDVTKTSLQKGIEKARAGNRLSEISGAIQDWVESHGFHIVKEFVGHGVGRKLHEPPQVPNFADGSRSPVLKPGMTLAIEPMVNAGTPEVQFMEDGWTVLAKDRKPSAHFEHTILITQGDPETLTVPEGSV